MTTFSAQTLWNRVQSVSEAALASGNLLPISTDISYVQEGGVEFPVRQIPHLAIKPKPHADANRDKRSPFLSPDPLLTVAVVSESHLCLLNKFPVFEHHVLIVTREFEDQDAPLNFDDFQALDRCMADANCLGFYNGGTMAGASQRHKHLQLVPLPLAPRGPAIPIEPMLERQSLSNSIGQSRLLPFPHVLAKFDEDTRHPERSKQMLAFYQRMLAAIGLKSDGSTTGAYNLLITRRWMLMVPRTREHFDTISLNALAFAGHFLVRNEAELNVLKEQEPLTALHHVTS